MSNNAVSVQAVRSPVQIDPATHLECLEFIRAAMDEADREFAQQIAAILKDVCQRGYADRVAIWSELTDIERQQFQELLGPPPLVREAGPENPRRDRLPVPRCGLRHRERVERGDRRWKVYSSRCFGGCWRNRIYPVQADCRMNQA